MASSTGTPIVVDTRALSRLARDLRRSAPKVYANYRVRSKAAMMVVANDARSRASYSDRIAGSVSNPRATATGNVKVSAGGPSAPDAAAIENRGKGFVRHPTFGHEPWTSLNSHPAFLAPAFDAHREMVMKAIESAFMDAVNEAIRGG
jgi:hypothetical protein